MSSISELPLARFVRSLQVRNRDYLILLQSMGLFNETNLYPIVVGYVASTCTITPEPTTLVSIDNPNSVIDRVVTPQFSDGLSGVRFCFPSVPTLGSLKGNMEIGLTIKSAPYNDNKSYIKVVVATESEYVTLCPTFSSEAKLFDPMSLSARDSPKCPLRHHLAYIDLLYDSSTREMTVRVAHAPTSDSINVLFLTQTITLVCFSNLSLYPLLSYRKSFDVSVHAID